jgi:predicted GNAT family acetyltransferase
VIRVYDEAGNVIETHERAGEFKELASVFVSPEQRRRGISPALA